MERLKIHKRASLLLAASLLAATVAATGALAAETGLKEGEPGYYAYEVMRHLGSEIGNRTAGSKAEAKTAAYIVQEFRGLGLEAELQPFEFTLKEGQAPLSSANVVATLPGKSPRVLYVGAHYDSVEVGKGADDNASGIGVMLEAAKAVVKSEVPYTIKFIAFGAEEVGLVGSYEYLGGMTGEDIGNAVAMINLDSLSVGDHMHIYGNSGTDGFVRELGLGIAERLKLDVSTQAGLNPLYPAGTTIDASDHVAFKYAGIPYGYLEATNWTLGAMDGYTQTEKDGEVWHTEKDTLEYVSANYPGRIEAHLNAFVQLLTQMLLEIAEPPAGPAFRDTSSVPWAEEAIDSLASMDIVLGDGMNDYHPGQAVSRAEAAAMLSRALGLLDPEATASFSDVPAESWYFPYVASLVKWKLAQGISADAFDPNGAITREQLAVIGANVLIGFTDKKAADPDAALAKYADRDEMAGYAREAIALATEQGLMQGTSDDAFDPKATVTRAQAAVMIHNLLKAW